NVATCVIEVRDGCARNYGGDYEAYLYAVNKEIDDGERERNAAKVRIPAEPNIAPAAEKKRPSGRDERKLRKEKMNLEKSIARLDSKKRELNEQLLSTTDAELA